MNGSYSYRKGEKPIFEYLREYAKTQPNKTAFIWYGREITYEELNQLSDAFAKKLVELGAEKGDRIALFLQNSPQYIIAHLGIQKIGGIVGPCSPLFKEQELEYQLNDLETRIIVADEYLFDIINNVKEKTKLEHVFLTNYADMLPKTPTMTLPNDLKKEKLIIKNTLDFVDVITSSSAAAVNYQPALDDVSLITYTSGTTGMPKGVMLTNRNALFKSFSVGDHNPIQDDDVLLCVAPVYHIAGMLVGINLTLYAGVSTVLLYRFDALNAMEAIDKYKVTWWYGAATTVSAVMDHPDVSNFDLGSLRLNPSTSFGIAVNEELAERWKKYAPNSTMFEVTYGLSETHTWDTTMPADAIRWGSHGKAVTGVEIRIVDPDTDEELAANEPGELTLRSPGNFVGYWNKPEATEQTLKNGWVYTGDRATVDEDGYLTFLGRYKELIKVSGYSVSPEEVEVLMVQHPYVKQVAIIGVNDPVQGQAVKAFIIPELNEPEASEEELIQWCKSKMSAYKAPKYIEFCSSFPTTGAGKVLRRLLK